jgi:hypothetical protein
MTPDALDGLTPEERNRFYKTLRLKMAMKLGGGLEICGPFPDTPVVGKTEGPSRWSL